jgi:glycosyltransferase involved in cell wall biosynthesis
MNRRSYSGSFYCMARALERHCGEVHCLGPVKTSAFDKIERVFDQTARKIVGKGYDYSHTIHLAKKYANFFKGKVSLVSPDWIFAPVASTEIAYLENTIPIVYESDGPLALVQDYYPSFSNYFRFSARKAHYIERLAIQKAALLIYSSHAAAESAIRHYQADESKIHIIPHGANFEDIPDRDAVLRPRRTDTCRMIFVGVDWVRKGADIAVDTLLSLRAMGIPAQLTICGCIPPQEVHVPGLQIIPFLDKNDPVQHKRLHELYLASDIFLLPTRGDLSPIVFCEANAFGLPVVTASMAGIPDIVTEGENGFLLRMGARASDYAKVISDIWRNERRGSALVVSSRKVFEEKLNWDAWATSLAKVVPAVLSRD